MEVKYRTVLVDEHGRHSLRPGDPHRVAISIRDRLMEEKRYEDILLVGGDLKGDRAVALMPDFPLWSPEDQVRFLRVFRDKGNALIQAGLFSKEQIPKSYYQKARKSTETLPESIYVLASTPCVPSPIRSSSSVRMDEPPDSPANKFIMAINRSENKEKSEIEKLAIQFREQLRIGEKEEAEKQIEEQMKKIGEARAMAKELKAIAKARGVCCWVSEDGKRTCDQCTFF